MGQIKKFEGLTRNWRDYRRVLDDALDEITAKAESLQKENERLKSEKKKKEDLEHTMALARFDIFMRSIHL